MNFDFVETDEGDILLEIRQGLKSGTKVRILVCFNKDDTMVSVYGLNYVLGINPSKRSYLYETVNDLNSKYTYFKFVLDKESVNIQAFNVVENNFESNIVMTIILGMLQVMDEEYPGLMRVMWS
jgi:hypothetical protein